MTDSSYKEEFISNYLKINGFTTCITSLTNSEIDIVFDLYKNNIVPEDNQKLWGLFGIYYEINKKYDLMAKYYIKSIKKYMDEGAANNLYNILKYTYYDQKIMDNCLNSIIRVLNYTGNECMCKICSSKLNRAKKFYKKYKKLHKSEVIGQINKAVHTNNNLYELYNELTNDSLKKYYLEKVCHIHNFKFTEIMMSDSIRFDIIRPDTVLFIPRFQISL